MLSGSLSLTALKKRVAIDHGSLWNSYVCEGYAIRKGIFVNIFKMPGHYNPTKIFAGIKGSALYDFDALRQGSVYKIVTTLENRVAYFQNAVGKMRCGKAWTVGKAFITDFFDFRA